MWSAPTCRRYGLGDLSLKARNNHRYQAEPLLSKTGTGSLSPASIEDRALEEKLSMDIPQKLMTESDSAGKKSAPTS